MTHEIESKNGVLQFYRDLINWTVEGRLPERRAGALAHLLDGYVRTLIPTLIEERLDELQKSMAIERKALQDRIALEANPQADT